MDPEPRQLDAVVVGAGISGLVAARALAARGASVRVLEARDRVGGRTLSEPLGSDIVDIGGQFVGPTQDRILALAKELGVATFKQYDQGQKIISLEGRIRTYTGLIPRVGVLSLLEAFVAASRLDRLRKSVPLDRPWDAPDAAALDGMTVETWKRGALRTAGARSLIDIAVRAIFAAEPRELSLLYFLFYLNSGGGLDRMGRVTDGAQAERLVGGAQEISKRIAAALGERVTCGAPVVAIEEDAEGVTVRTRGGLAQRARLAILALAPALARRIEFSPALPARREALAQRMPMGSVIKCIVTYERPFWRERGFSGEVVCDRGPVPAVFDDCSHDGKQAALLCFVLADAAWALGRKPPEERRREVEAALVRFFGPEAARSTGYADKDWSADPWSGGCYAGIMPPGVMTTFGDALRSPCGRIHFAGTETAARWNGYFDGAVESGERAAAEVAARLASARRP